MVQSHDRDAMVDPGKMERTEQNRVPVAGCSGKAIGVTAMQVSDDETKWRGQPQWMRLDGDERA